MPCCKIYITDEGFGPIVRQSAIIDEIKTLLPSLRVTIQAKQHIEEARRIIKNADFIKKSNLILWSKRKDGSPDTEAIRKFFITYNSISDKFIKEEKKEKRPDFFISDFVYEAFEIASMQRIPAFGVAHFTWDWFFSKLYPPPLESKVLKRFFDFANKARVLYFPPFTPREITSHYRKKAKMVPLIVRKISNDSKKLQKRAFNILIIDSGSGLLAAHISNALKHIKYLSDFHFYLSSSYQGKGKNITTIDKNELFIDYIPKMDLVIGRAGFNTISECIAYRTPMLLLSEAINPEMNENILNIKKAGLGSFISIEDFSENLHHFLPRFIRHEYALISENIKSHDYRTDGARVIAEDILNRIKL